MDRKRWWSTLRVRPATLADVDRIVAFHRASTPAASRAKPSTALAWFRHGGPWMHPTFCANHLRRYRRARGDVLLVEIPGERLAGMMEIWYDTEPSPFGRYGHLELLELDDECDVPEVEHWLIELAERRAWRRGYRRFWCRPEGSGGTPRVLEARGYWEAWRNSVVHVSDLAAQAPSTLAWRPAHAAGGGETARLLLLNHREAAGYRWGYLWGPVRSARQSDYPAWQAFRAARVTLAQGGTGWCVVTTGPARPAGTAVADLLVPPGHAGHASVAREMLAVAGHLARDAGARSLEACLPVALAQKVLGGGVGRGWLWNGDPWYVKQLSASP